MNRKLIFTLILLCLAVVSISGVSAFWPFDSGSDVTVNGVNFHLPKGFDDVKENHFDSPNNYEAYTYENDDAHEYIKICVMDTDLDKQSIYDSLCRKGYGHETVNGKDGVGRISTPGPRYGFFYVENNKYVMVDIPFVYAEEGLQHDELLAQIIK